MIIGSDTVLEVGKRYVRPIIDSNYVRHEAVPYLVLRVASFEEWLAYNENPPLTQGR